MFYFVLFFSFIISKTENAIFICSGSYFDMIKYILLTLYVFLLTLTKPFSAKTPSQYFRWAITDLFWQTFYSQIGQCKSLCASNLQASRYDDPFFALSYLTFSYNFYILSLDKSYHTINQYQLNKDDTKYLNILRHF